jgi:hypothetical protein
LQILANRAYLVAQVDDKEEGGKFVSKAIATAEGPEQAVRKVRNFLTKRGDLTTERFEMQAIELGDVPDTCDLDQPLLLKNGEEFEW